MDPPGDHIEEDQREGDEDDDQSVGRDDESPPEEDDAEDDYDDNDDTKEDDEQPPDPTPPRTADPIHDFQPDYAKANSLPFYVLCRRLDVLLQQRLSKDRQSREELFHYLFPNQLRQYIGQGSWFPLLRLIMPDIDTSRPHTGLKEKTIALAWAEALGLAPHSPSYQRILHYSDPTYFETVGTAGVGDLSSVIYNEMQRRTGDEQSGLTVGHINDLLDALVKLKTTARGNHDWRNTNTANTTNKPSNLKQHRRQWVETLLHKNLSALEHKWVVRILLQKVEIGFSYKTILEHWRPGAMQLYRMNNNLKSVCTTLCNPYWIQQEIQRQEEQQQGQGTVHWLERTNGHAVLGNTIAPMLALKVYFRNALAELARPHREYAKRNVEKQQRHLLSLKNPAFIAEVKLDGERMVVHVEQGKVTMHTRRGRWYSDLYSPVLAPPIRRALQRYNVNVVLDGEVIAWDNGRQEAIPFGNNRTVALARKRWLDSQGLLEERDSNLHQGQTDLNVMKAGGYDQDGVDNEAGSDCWLRYELFDVLYVGGPDAARVIAVATNRTGEEDTIETGSVIHLNGFQRKRLLYQIITPQEKEVMVVPSLVIRPNGVGVNADEYFSATDPLQAVNGQDASIVDSIEWAFEANESDREEYDSQMRGRLSDTEISLKRAEATDCFYADIVDKRGLEGIVMKDLNASYLLEGRKYWAKHKPDHEENSQLNDIDLIILGAYHGTGMGPSGILNAFLLGCVDDEDPDTYCAVCKVNGGGVARDELNKLLESTGYQRRTDSTPWDPGQWFREENHGSSVPDFISKRSFQNEERDSPVFKKKVYPDLWIRPDDSVVLAIKASEIVAADAFQAGITLRFPRIQRIRQKGSGDDKEARQVETLEGLHQAYREQMARREGAGEIEFQSGDVEGRANRRFQTAEEGLRKKTNKRNITQGPEWTMPKADRKESSALDGLALVALEGVYRLEGLDLEEASEQGWRETAQSIKGRDDMLRYISIHGGTPKISVSQDTDFVVGGRADDARVIMHHNGLEHAIKESRKSRSKTGLTTDVMVRIGGVLKWTYVIAIVHQWKEAMKSFKYEDDEEANNMFSTSSIKYTHPELLKPSRHYYLLASSSSFKRGEEVFGISTKDVCTLIDFKRGLEAVANHRRRDNEKRARLNQESPDAVPWQYRALNVVQPELRWSVATPFQKLWPFTKDSGSAGDAVVIYPDLFGQDFGEKRSQDAQSNGRLDQISNAASAIESVLPLARLLGAQVTTHLHEGVTHVLCQLDTDKDYVAFADFDGIEYCDGQEHARQLRARLWSMHGQDCRVHFVTPSWIRNQWQSED